MPLTLRWLGNAGFEFQFKSTIFHIDPFLTRPKAGQIFFGHVAPDETALQKHIPHVDHILVTHAHFDHCMDVPEIALRVGAVVHGSKNTCRLMQAADLPEKQIHQISIKDTVQIGTMHISILPAVHPWIPGYTPGKIRANLEFPLRLRDYRMDECFNFLIDTGETKILVWSSTSSTGAPEADILTCRAVSNQRWYDNLLTQVNPQLVIPQHWDDFFPTAGSPTAPFL